MNKYYWHMHHTMLFEVAVESIERRVEFIKAHKPEDERSTRLRLIAPVKNQRLMHRLCKYERDFKTAEDKIFAKYEKYNAKPPYLTSELYAVKLKELAEVRKAYEDAKKRAWPRIEALHKRECKDCPWNGHTIFPNKSIY